MKRGPGVNTYGDSHYASDHRDLARRTIRRRLARLEKEFLGTCALDLKDAALFGSDAMARHMFLRRGWEVFFDFAPFEIVVYIHRKDGQWPSFVFLHRPPCFMACTDPGVPTPNHSKTYRKDAKKSL